LFSRYNATADTEDIEELVPESLFFRSFAFDARPFLRKGDRTMADFIPRKRHRKTIAKARPVLRVVF
jgi:hypothetical protein